MKRINAMVHHEQTILITQCYNLKKKLKQEYWRSENVINSFSYY